jgi:hypothetical protein
MCFLVRYVHMYSTVLLHSIAGDSRSLAVVIAAAVVVLE